MCASDFSVALLTSRQTSYEHGTHKGSWCWLHLPPCRSHHQSWFDINKLFIDVFYYFYHSSKQKQEFCDVLYSLLNRRQWRSLFTSEPPTILKHCPTRWLSLLRCVGRYLTQFDGLLFVMWGGKEHRWESSYKTSPTFSFVYTSFNG